MQSPAQFSGKNDLRGEDIPPYYAALAPVYMAHGIRFWNNVGNFASSWPNPGDFKRIVRQYEAGKPYRERTIIRERGRNLGLQ